MRIPAGALASLLTETSEELMTEDGATLLREE
jgi:hypothetical protein